MPNYDPSAKMLYVPPAQTITASGNSGTTLLDLRSVQDVVLLVTITGSPAGTNPTLVVGLDITDSAGNWVAQVIKTASLTAAGTVAVYGGTHAAGSAMVVLPAQGRVSWTIGGTASPSFAAQIVLFGR